MTKPRKPTAKQKLDSLICKYENKLKEIKEMSSEDLNALPYAEFEMQMFKMGFFFTFLKDLKGE